MARQAKEHYEAGHWTIALAHDVETVTLPGELSLKDEAWASCITAVHRGCATAAQVFQSRMAVE
jgi:hypothetical protein